MRLLSLFLLVLGMTGVAGGCGTGGAGQSPSVSLPVIAGFSATPSSITVGQGSTLSWSVSGAITLAISSGVGAVTGLSSKGVTPTGTTTYVLTASNSAGSVEASVTVTVTAAGPYPVGLSQATMQVGAVARDYRVHVPANLVLPPKALVFVLHGGGGEGMEVANTGAHPLSVFRSVADREGFVVIYPGGLPALDGSPGWNDCRDDNLVASAADDVGFLAALVERVRGEYSLPLSRIFLAGGSNGAQMVLCYAELRSTAVAAIAVSSGNMPLNPKPRIQSISPSRPVPVLMAHGTADVLMPYAGGCVANLGGGCARGRVIGAEATRDFWLGFNGLTSVTPSESVIDLSTADAGPANRFFYAGAAPVEWWRLDGAGHTAASRTVLIEPNATRGIQNRDVEFAEIAWDFFKGRLAVAAAPDAAAIRSARDYSVAAGGQTLLVMHEGKVLEETYANGGAADRRQLLASGTKGFTGILGAIAAADALFGLDEPVAERALVEWQQDPQKARITYRHLLTMTSGLEELNDLPGWAAYLNARAIHPPGSTFVYSGDPNIFGLALERRLGGESVIGYFNRKLFQPLGMTSIQWGSNFADGHPQLSGGAYATARDWARFGEFVRRMADGSWEGPSLLPRSVFEQVVAGNPAAHPAYGFYWWLKRPVPDELAASIDANNQGMYSRLIKPIIDSPRIPGDVLMAAGAYDQRLYVIPSRGLTVVRNGPIGTSSFDDVAFLERLLGDGTP